MKKLFFSDNGGKFYLAKGGLFYMLIQSEYNVFTEQTITRRLIIPVFAAETGDYWEENSQAVETFDNLLGRELSEDEVPTHLIIQRNDFMRKFYLDKSGKFYMLIQSEYDVPTEQAVTGRMFVSVSEAETGGYWEAWRRAVEMFDGNLGRELSEDEVPRHLRAISRTSWGLFA